MSTPYLDPMQEIEEYLKRRGLHSRPAPTRTPAGHEAMTHADWSPAIDIVETTEEYVVKAELTEVPKDAIRISANSGVLTLQGERRMEQQAPGFRYHRVERPYGTFQRSFSLPDDVEVPNIRAEQREGMLYLHLPKHKEQHARAVQIPVQ
jgi:HSP20 family protein